MAVFETFEDVVGNWNVSTDTSGDGDVVRSSDQAYAGTYSAKCTSTSSGDVAQCRITTAIATTESHYWLPVRVYVPSATTGNLTGSEYLRLAGIWDDGANAGWFVEIIENAGLRIRGYVNGSWHTPDVYGTIPTDQWVELELGLYTLSSAGINRAFMFGIDGDFYGWYRQGALGGTFDRAAVGILDTNSNDDLAVYVDQWMDSGSGSTPEGTDNRSDSEYQYHDFRDQSGISIEMDWGTWENQIVLSATHGIYCSPRFQAGHNQDLAPAYGDGWAAFEISWPNGTPTDTTPDEFFGPMIGFHKMRANEENLEIVPYGGGDGTVALRYEAWPRQQGEVYDSWALPEASIGGGSHIPEDGDIYFVRWEEVSGTEIRVIVDYYDASATTWYNRVIETTDDLSNVDPYGIDFLDADHDDVTITIDSGDYGIKWLKFGQLTSAPRKRLTTTYVDSDSSEVVGGVQVTTYTRKTTEVDTDIVGSL